MPPLQMHPQGDVNPDGFAKADLVSEAPEELWVGVDLLQESDILREEDQDASLARVFHFDSLSLCGFILGYVFVAKKRRALL